MVSRIRLYCYLIVAIAVVSAFIGLSNVVVGPYMAADALEEAIRGARTSDEIRSKIAHYFSSTALNRLILLVGPGVVIAVTAALALWELGGQDRSAADDAPAKSRSSGTKHSP